MGDHRIGTERACSLNRIGEFQFERGSKASGALRDICVEVHNKPGPQRSFAPLRKNLIAIAQGSGENFGQGNSGNGETHKALVVRLNTGLKIGANFGWFASS
jgi:hypothetical protein